MADTCWENASDDRNVLLILCVKDMPHLYDKNRTDYKDPTKKMNSWEKIAKMLQTMCNFQVDAIEVKARWKTLREEFSTEHKKLNEYVPSGSAQRENDEKWCYYDTMDFLKPHMDHYKHDSNYKIPETLTDNTFDSEDNNGGKDFECQENLKQPKEESLDFELMNELESFINSKASAEDFAIKENEELLKSSGKQLMSLLQMTSHFESEAEMSPFQCLLVKKFGEIPEDKQIYVFNKLMDIMEKELNPTGGL